MNVSIVIIIVYVGVYVHSYYYRSDNYHLLITLVSKKCAKLQDKKKTLYNYKNYIVGNPGGASRLSQIIQF